MIVVISEQWHGMDYGGRGKPISTPFGEFVGGEVVEAPYRIAEWFLHNGLAQVARNWRIAPEKTAPVPIPTRVIE